MAKTAPPQREEVWGPSGHPCTWKPASLSMVCFADFFTIPAASFCWRAFLSSLAFISVDLLILVAKLNSGYYFYSSWIKSSMFSFSIFISDWFSHLLKKRSLHSVGNAYNSPKDQDNEAKETLPAHSCISVTGSICCEISLVCPLIYNKLLSSGAHIS